MLKTISLALPKQNSFFCLFFQTIDTFPGMIFILSALVNLLQATAYFTVYLYKNELKVEDIQEVQDKVVTDIEMKENKLSTNMWDRDIKSSKWSKNMLLKPMLVYSDPNLNSLYTSENCESLTIIFATNFEIVNTVHQIWIVQ